MNRINKYTINGKQYFDVLLTPNYVSNPGFELVLGNWLDEDFNVYKVITTKTLQEAMNISWNYPDIDWARLVNAHKDNYTKLFNTIRLYLNNMSIPVNYESKLLMPEEAKYAFFKRVKNNNKRFTVFYNFNDVMTFDIYSPYSKVVDKIKNELMQVPELHVKKIIPTKSHIKLIGITEFNTTYEIRIWTSLYYNFFKWLYINNEPLERHLEEYKKIQINQYRIDQSYD